MEQIITYKTEDGKSFTDQLEALRHETMFKYIKAYLPKAMTLNNSEEVPADIVFHWLLQNKDFVESFYKDVDPDSPL